MNKLLFKFKSNLLFQIKSMRSASPPNPLLYGGLFIRLLHELLAHPFGATSFGIVILFKYYGNNFAIRITNIQYLFIVINTKLEYLILRYSFKIKLLLQRTNLSYLIEVCITSFSGVIEYVCYLLVVISSNNLPNFSFFNYFILN